MAARRFGDVRLSETNKLRLGNLSQNKGKALFDLIIEICTKHAPKKTDRKAANFDKSKHYLFEMIDHLRNEVATLYTGLEKIKRENMFTQSI